MKNSSTGKPYYRVNINIVDNQDSENGLTTAALRFGIVLYVTPPDDWEEHRLLRQLAA